MRRVITYLYRYEEENKKGNIGFIKLLINEKEIEAEIIIKGCKDYSKEITLFLVYDCKKKTQKTLGKINLFRGSGKGKMTFSNEDIEKCIGIKGKLNDNEFIASCWMDDGQEGLKEYEIVLEEDEVDSEEIQNDTENREELEQQECKQEVSEEEPVSNKKNYERINLVDIHSLPKRNWYLCNNSFLLHGFFNYNYLVIWKKKDCGVDRTYLGVPGIYERPERMMAMLFGFPEFEPEKELPPNSNLEGVFGYWLCLLDI